MDLRNRLFPYPVIGEGFDDYKKSTFISDVKVDTYGNKIRVTANFTLDNEAICQFMQNDYFVYAIHIECPETSFRNVYMTREERIDIEVDESKISGKIEIASLLICNKDIYNYTNYDLNDDYEGAFFTFEKGNIIGIGGQVKANIDKEKEELGKLPSIISIIMKKGNEKNFSIDCNGDKIKILLNEKDYQNYKKISTVKRYQGIFHSMIAMPALIYVFDIMRGHIEDFEDYRWFRGLSKSLVRYKINLNEESLEKESVELAQMVLDMPLNRALENLSIDECEEGEEE